MQHNNDMRDPAFCDPPELVEWVARHAIEKAGDKNVLAEQLEDNRNVVREWLRKKRKTFITELCHKHRATPLIGHIEHFLTAVLEEMARQLQNEEESE